MPQAQREVGTSLSDINMVPFIDVVLVLLIIFMITAPILQSG
ncbi:MAG TPA: biopolymer transporter ExbD, partial [Verrucomicrobiae bacterium]|nr:biopolymer transporter ExbD [Verrucomicrobiae bacterium]